MSDEQNQNLGFNEAEPPIPDGKHLVKKKRRERIVRKGRMKQERFRAFMRFFLSLGLIFVLVYALKCNGWYMSKDAFNAKAGNTSVEIINNKNESKKDLRNEQLKQEFKAIDKNYCRSKIAYINLDKKLVKELKEDLKIIKASLPTKGRLNYAFMPDSTKQLLDNFIDKLIENNFDCKRCYENYIKSWEKIAEFYDNYYYGEVVSNANIEAHKILGNQLLRYFKEEQYLHYSIEQILQDLYYVLSQSEEREKSFLQRYVFNKDLSIYAKKEYVFKHKFSNYIERDI